MPPIDDVLHRLETDAAFKNEVVRDPKTSLQGYDLSPAELTELTQHLAADQEALDPVEQRTAKAGLFALFTNAMDHGGGRVRTTGGDRRSVDDVVGFDDGTNDVEGFDAPSS